MSDSPNLVFLWTDQQAANTLGAYGNEVIDTPHLDRLSANGTTFENAYLSQPTCTPSRSTVMTGLYPHTTGCVENNVPLASNAQCFPELGDFSDYETAFIGKWHLGDEIFSQHGFDEWVSIEDTYRRFYGSNRPSDAHSSYHQFLVDQGFEPDCKEADGFEWFSREFCANLPEEYTKAAYVARKAQQFIRENRDDPFILHVMFLEPHMPFTGPRNDQYSPDDVPLPENFEHDGFDDQPLRTRLIRNAVERGRYAPSPGLPGSSPTEDDWRRLIANYWGLVSLVDSCVGDIVRTISDCGLDDDTITVFTSDHGDMMGSHQLVSKFVMYEEAIKVPLIMDIPDVEKNGSRVEAPVSQVDLVPTLLDAMDQPVSDHLQGHSWLPFLDNDGELQEENVFVEWNGPSAPGIRSLDTLSLENWKPGVTGTRPHPDPDYMEVWEEVATEEEIMRAMTDPIRTIITPDGWKLNYYRESKNELFDLNEDSGEIHNLIDDPAHEDTAERLEREIVEWQRRTRDPMYLV